MKYDFDTVVDRGGNRSAKYDERMKKFGTDQVIPCLLYTSDAIPAARTPILRPSGAGRSAATAGTSTRA